MRIWNINEGTATEETSGFVKLINMGNPCPYFIQKIDNDRFGVACHDSKIRVYE